MTMRDTTSIQVGRDVLDRDGDKIGTVADVGNSYVLVQKGLIFTKDVYIPSSELQTGSDGALFVNVDKDEIEEMGWDEASAQRYGREEYRDEQATTSPSYETRTSDDGDRIRLHEEELTAQSNIREAGAVEVTKDVVEEQRSLDVPVSREEVHVRRVPTSDSAADPSDAFQSDSVRVPVMEEQVEVTKTPRVVEELEIEKRRTTDTQRVSDTVRREEARVDEQGNVDLDRDAR